jgi:hypothetical protein
VTALPCPGCASEDACGDAIGMVFDVGLDSALLLTAAPLPYPEDLVLDISVVEFSAQPANNETPNVAIAHAKCLLLKFIIYFSNKLVITEAPLFRLY